MSTSPDGTGLASVSPDGTTFTATWDGANFASTASERATSEFTTGAVFLASGVMEKDTDKRWADMNESSGRKISASPLDSSDNELEEDDGDDDDEEDDEEDEDEEDDAGLTTI